LCLQTQSPCILSSPPPRRPRSPSRRHYSSAPPRADPRFPAKFRGYEFSLFLLFLSPPKAQIQAVSYGLPPTAYPTVRKYRYKIAPRSLSPSIRPRPAHTPPRPTPSVEFLRSPSFSSSSYEENPPRRRQPSACASDPTTAPTTTIASYAYPPCSSRGVQ